MDTRYIAAIEIGSSKIKGLIASVGELGDITLLAAEETKVSNCVRYGRISNVQEVTLHVNRIIRKLENSPAVMPGKVSAVCLALGGRSFATMAVQASTKLPSAIEITADTVERLKREASFGLVVTDKETLALLPKTFYVDNTEVKNVVGTIGSQIKAEFSALVCAPDNKRNLERIKIETSDQQPRREYIYRPLAQADLVLSPDEKQIGCALVDFGAETTTVSVYKNDVLQAIVTLPMGSRNITRDLMAGLSMTEENAEVAKSTVGSAMSEAAETDNTKVEINNYIQARAGEIIANTVHQIEAVGFKAQDLPGGLVFIGGGARLNNFLKLAEAQTKMPVRPGKINSSITIKTNGIDLNENIDIIAIAKYAAVNTDIDCLTRPVVAEPDDDGDDYIARGGTVIAGGTRRHVSEDDENLLEDDDEDDDEDGRRYRFRKKKERRQASKVPVDDIDEEVGGDDPDDGGDTGESGGIMSRINKVKEKLAGFFADKSAGDDLDEPTV